MPLLLRDMHIEMRTLGAELLAVFTRVQSPVDSKLDAIQAHVPQVGVLNNGHTTAAGVHTATQAAGCAECCRPRQRKAQHGLKGSRRVLRRHFGACVRAQVCRVAQGALKSDRKEQKLQETAERRRAGDKLAVPDPIYLIGRRWGGCWGCRRTDCPAAAEVPSTGLWVVGACGMQ